MNKRDRLAADDAALGAGEGGDHVDRDERGLRGGWTRFQRHHYLEPSADLAPFVERYWAATWDLRGERPYRQLIVPYPNVHLSFVNGLARVHGVSRGNVFRELAGFGRVFGVAFRPGCFRPFLDGPVSDLTDRSVPASDVFGPEVPEAAMAAAADEAEMRQIVEVFVRAHLPTADPVAEEVAGIVARIAADPAVMRVEGLAARLATSPRRLQRLFADYVGVGPKWVIRRYRLHEITERLEAGGRVDWARIAAELGYADQAHLSRDFTKIVGETPTQYAQRYPESGADAPPRVNRG